MTIPAKLGDDSLVERLRSKVDRYELFKDKWMLEIAPLLREAADALETAYHNIRMGGKVEEAQARRIEVLEAGLRAAQEFERAADAYSEDSTLTNAEAYDRAKHRLWKAIQAAILLAPEPKPQEEES